MLNELNSQQSFWVFLSEEILRTWASQRPFGFELPCFAVLSSTDPVHAQHLSLHLWCGKCGQDKGEKRKKASRGNIKK